MNKVFRFMQILLTVSLFTVLPLLIFTLISSKTGVLGGVRSFTVVSGSMQPAISVGSIVFVQKQNSYGPGEVVAFKNLAGKTVTHRIDQTVIKNGEVLFQTKGDANSNADSEFVSSKDVVGKEILSIPTIGRIGEILKNPYGFIALIVTPTIIFVGLELLNIKREMEKEIEKKLLSQLGMRSV